MRSGHMGPFSRPLRRVFGQLTAPLGRRFLRAASRAPRDLQVDEGRRVELRDRPYVRQRGRARSPSADPDPLHPDSDSALDIAWPTVAHHHCSLRRHADAVEDVSERRWIWLTRTQRPGNRDNVELIGQTRLAQLELLDVRWSVREHAAHDVRHRAHGRQQRCRSGVAFALRFDVALGGRGGDVGVRTKKAKGSVPGQKPVLGHPVAKSTYRWVAVLEGRPQTLPGGDSELTTPRVMYRRPPDPADGLQRSVNVGGCAQQT